MKYIEIKLPRCTVFLTAAEIGMLLQREPALFAAGILRGKGILRARTARARNGKTPARCRDPGGLD